MLNLLKHWVSQPKGSVVSWHGADPVDTASNYYSLVSEGFLKNVFVYRAISLISNSIASIPMSVRNSDSSKNEYLSQLINRPNSYQGHSAFMTYVINYLLLAGNVFVHFNGKELHCLRPDRVKILPNREKTDVAEYEYAVDAVKIKLKRENIVHLKLFNPLDDWYGFAPIKAAIRATEQYNEMSKHNLSILKNGGRPSGCLMVKGAKNLTDEQKIQLRDQLRNAYSGTSNAGKMMVLEGDFEWKEMGLSPKDMDFITARNSTAREIVQAFGVPPILVGIRGDSSFSNYKEARLHFWEDTILPLAEFIRIELTHWINCRFIQSAEIIFNLDAIPALASKREILWDRISSAKFLTDDEKRALLGFSINKTKD